MAQVLMPQKKKDDALSTLMTGLSATNQIYGIKKNMAEADAADTQKLQMEAMMRKAGLTPKKTDEEDT